MTDRKALSLVFRRARLYLARNEEHLRYQDKYICHAIDSVRGANSSIRKAAQDIIADRIAPFHCMENWLIYKANVIYKNDLANMGDQIQEFRHRWLDDLAHEFSK